MTEITHLKPNTMALFYSIDGNPKFGVKLCHERGLFDAVRLVMFARDAEEDREEINGYVKQLRESGGVDFEDGWLSLRVGMADVVAFLMSKIVEAKAEERYADNERFNELKRREEAETRYAALRAVLLDALGDKAPDLAKAAA